jgi:hypothetical protein
MFVETKVSQKTLFNSKILVQFCLGTAVRILTVIRLHLMSLNRDAKILLNHLPPHNCIPLRHLLLTML